ncbi:ATP-dependent DNA helicase II subunit 1 [Zalerion maritima]|uniref:ATP-dependent DNA helicase II subunit 1 n=1 Tax=Zalerion maritima TaxID=339359 RepID=A0AAD5RXC6_9PEZI|nr:ATP-dependent DNA helicase II subunit 1 [Zalerion maritima]
MADDNKWRASEEEEDEELDENDYKSQKDAILFAIDVSHSMLKPPPASTSKKADKDSAVLAALKSAYQVMQQRIISNPKDMMGIMLFGTEKSRFQEDSGRPYPHCYLFVDLDIPSANDVKALKYLVEDGDDPAQVLTPSEEPVTMANVLFCANQIFTTKAANFGSRRLFIITDNDDPHALDKQARSAAAVRAKDLYDLGVVIELFPIRCGDSQFDLTKFYDDIVYRDPAQEEDLERFKASKSGDGLSLLSSLVSNINSKQVAKRAMFSNLPFEIAPGLRISVKGYNIIHSQKPARTCYVWLDGETPQLAVGETTRMADESTRTVEKTELKKAYKFGGEFVHFSPEEQKEIRSFGSPILRIIGFKPRKLLPFWAAVKKPVFLFPSEDDYVGSTRVFTALWRKLLDSDKMGVAWFVARSNSSPILVAILPSNPQPSGDEELDSGTPFLPAGLWLHPLPFADDLRDGPDPPKEPLRAGEELTKKMRVIVQQLQLPKAMYNPKKYPNPALQWHYRILQALALEEEVPEEPDDATLPKYKAINNRAGGYIQDWSEKLHDDARALNLSIGGGVKREPGDDDKPAKKARSLSKTTGVKKEGTPGAVDIAGLRRSAQAGTVSKMTVAELRDALAGLKLPTTGKKAELIERMESWAEADN